MPATRSEISEMRERIAKKKSEGMIGVRLFVPDTLYITPENIAHDFNVIEAICDRDNSRPEASRGTVVVTNFDKM